MKFKGSTKFTHDQGDKIGVLVINLGTPDAPTPAALRKYLGEFLSDPRVVEIPRLIWWLILNLVILRIRPRKSAEAYKSVWTDEGSPLMVHTRNQSLSLQKNLQDKGLQNVIVDYAMRYGNPGLVDKVESLLSSGVRKLLVLPLYPQYSATTTASTFDAISRDFAGRRWIPDIRFISHYHDHPAYIDAMARHIQDYWNQHGKSQKLVLSYHGIPKRNLHEGDPYFCECHKTSRLLIDKLGVDQDFVLTTFQSRFGKQEWLQPYTDATLKSLPSKGIRSLQVFCPGFPADCLETLEEIAVENRRYFIEAGGEHYDYISALNDLPVHIEALSRLITDNLQGWVLDGNAKARSTLAHQLGAKQ